MNDDTTQAALISSLKAPAGQSKKYKMCMIGLGCILFVVVLSFATMLKKPEVSVSVASIVSVALLAIGTMVSISVGATAFVDGKTTDGLSGK